MNKRKLISVVLGLAGTTFFLWLALKDVSLSQLTQALASANWFWLIPMAAIVYLDLFIRAVRWRVLLSRARPGASIAELARLEAIGLGVNNVLFLRLGELARGVLAARRLNMPVFAALASVVVERALDVAALLTIFIIASGLAPGYAPAGVRLGAEFVLTGALVALALLALAETAVADGGFVERALRPWPKVHSLVSQLALGATVLREPLTALNAAVLSLILWTVDAGLYWAGAQALGLGAIMDYPRAVLTLSWAGACWAQACRTRLAVRGARETRGEFAPSRRHASTISYRHSSDHGVRVHRGYLRHRKCDLLPQGEHPGLPGRHD